MTISSSEKEKIIKGCKLNDSDTGSVELQIANLTISIRQLTEHLQDNPKDYSSKRGLFKMVSRRRSFLKYMERKDVEKYRKLIGHLGLKR